MLKTPLAKYVECPYCEGPHSDIKRTGIYECDLCMRMFRVVTKKDFTSPDEDELEELDDQDDWEGEDDEEE